MNTSFNFPTLSFWSSFVLSILLLSSCTRNSSEQENPDVTANCKAKPGRITYGRDATEIEYNAQHQPGKITTTEYDPASPAQPPLVTDYTVVYNAAGKPESVWKTVNSQPLLSYKLDYNANGQVTRQSMSNAQGMLMASTLASYDNNNNLKEVVTHTEGNAHDVKTVYEYANESLVSKSIENLYDTSSQEFYRADFFYTYYEDTENKMTPLFEGLPGLLFISNVLKKQSLQFLPAYAPYQLFYAQETFSVKKMAKSLQIIAHRYNTQDTTAINYSYQYDTDGYPTLQRVTYQNTIRRYETTPYGGSVLVVTPHESEFERTLNLYCE